jgi:UDP-2-acetamido-2,6-beta-L-arabino-hexul-4-ose reductase
MRILVTGSRGFVGRNLCLRLGEISGVHVEEFHRDIPLDMLPRLVAQADAIFHLAGVNRPTHESSFNCDNVELTATLSNSIVLAGGHKRLLFTSSIQSGNPSPYGQSKLLAEEYCTALRSLPGMTVAICRYPNIFGKWAKPHYNSVIATFCHLGARSEPLDVRDRNATLTLMHVDDAVEQMVRFAFDGDAIAAERPQPVYESTLGDVADTIIRFAEGRAKGEVGHVGVGLERALYATFTSYLPKYDFSYPLAVHRDSRGVFVEMLKTPSSGQFSFFSAGEGVTRGAHYHHSKTEKFLVVVGLARFRFRSIISNETVEFTVSGTEPTVVESIPGWAHDITNVGESELFVMLWSNEVFDPTKPDTIPARLEV